MTLFLFADLHDTGQQESGLTSAFEQSLIDNPYHYLVRDGQGHRETQALQLDNAKAQLVVTRFLAADSSYIGTAAQRVCAPHFAAVSATLPSQATKFPKKSILCCSHYRKESMPSCGRYLRQIGTSVGSICQRFS